MITPEYRNPAHWDGQSWMGRSTPAACTTPVGTPILLVEDDLTVTFTRTRSEPWRLGHGELVVLVEGRTGGYLLSRCFVMPDRSKQ